jgi:spermidine synthase
MRWPAVRAIFLASGAAALMEQAVWQRLLALFNGADVGSATVVVTAFMAGLGAGSLAGGQLAARLGPSMRLRAFALAELGIATFALLSVPLYHRWLPAWLAPAATPWPVCAVAIVVTLLLPTFLMGLSLPLLAQNEVDAGLPAENGVAALYGLNTLGAGLGAIVTPFLLIRSVGLDGALAVAASVNAACAIGSFTLASGTPRATPASAGASPGADGPSFRVFMLLFALSGFVGLSLEIVWLRLLGVAIKSSSFTFATLLGLYLLGLGIGALLGRPLARRTRSPRRVFLLLQWAAVAYVPLPLWAIAHYAGRVEFPHSYLLWTYMGEYNPFDMATFLTGLGHTVLGQNPALFDADVSRLFVMLYLIGPLLLAGLPTLLFGVSYPFLQKTVQTDPGMVGRRVGWLQAANIAGSAAGASLTGLVLLGCLGSAGTVRLLVASSGVFLWVWASGRAVRRILALAATSVALAAVPSASDLWAGMHLSRPERVIFAEDGSGVALLKQRPESDSSYVVYVNGIGQSGLPFGDKHTLLGVLPVLVHAGPRSVAIVGLGSGDTAYAALARPETERLACLEIVAPLEPVLRRLDAQVGPPGLHDLFLDPRLRLATVDGRAYLERSSERYDVIEADALRPTSAFAGCLYSREYFALVRSRLAPGGLAVTWAPTTRIRETFASVFPGALAFGDILIGGQGPVAWDPGAVRAQARREEVQGHFRRAGVALDGLLDRLLAADPERLSPPSSLGDLNTDLFPRDEYQLAPR